MTHVEKFVVVVSAIILGTLAAASMWFDITQDRFECVKYAPQSYYEVIVDTNDGRGPHRELRKSHMNSDYDGQCIDRRPVPNSSKWARWHRR